MPTKPSDEHDPYEFAPEIAPPPKPPTRLPPPPAPTHPTKLNYRVPNLGQPKHPEPETIKNVYLPLWLLAGSVFTEILAALIWNRHDMMGALRDVFLSLIASTIVMLIGILLAAKIRHIDLGPFGQSIYKLAAISIAPTALMEFVWPILNFVPLGFLVGWIVQFCFYFALLGALFDLDESDTWYCVWTILLAQLGFYALMLLIVHR